jgi:AcrR family transcriptional regulator
MHSKADIITIAGDLFSERGYHGTSMRDLAKTLDLQGASLYSHVKSKEEMLCEIVNHVADEFLRRVKTISQEQSVEQRIAHLVQAHLSVIANELPYVTVFYQEWKFLDAPLRNAIQERRDAYEAYFRETIEEGIQQGVFAVENAHLATVFVLSALNWTYHWFRPDGPMTIEQVTDQYTTFVLRALQGGQL